MPGTPTERPLLGAMTAAPGTYRVRAAAIDAADGPARRKRTIDAGLTQVGACRWARCCSSASRGGTTALQLQFGPSPRRAPPSTSMAVREGQRLSATLEVSRDLDGPAIAALPLALTRADDDARRRDRHRAPRRPGARRLRRPRRRHARRRHHRPGRENAAENREVALWGQTTV